MKKTAIEISNLEVAYKNRVILKKINLNIESGSFVTVIGPNGAGKSTLIKCICQLQKYKGKINLFGKDIKFSDKKNIGYLPQNNISDKNSPVTVFEVVSIGLFAKNGILKNLTKKDLKVINNVLKMTGISYLKDMLIGKVSGGEAQKVAISRILAQHPKIILLDEPQSNLDPKAQTGFFNLIGKLYKKFKFTVVMVTHDIDSIPKYCKRVVMLKNSSIVLDTQNKNIKEKIKKHKVYV